MKNQADKGKVDAVKALQEVKQYISIDSAETDTTPLATKNPQSGVSKSSEPVTAAASDSLTAAASKDDSDAETASVTKVDDDASEPSAAVDTDSTPRITAKKFA